MTATRSEIEDLIGEVNVELTTFKNWTCVNRLALSINKTNVVLFSNRLRSDGIQSNIVVGDMHVEYYEVPRIRG